MATTAQQKIKKQLTLMLIIVMGMFAFCFALVPLYNVICKVTGLNGKPTAMVAAVSEHEIDLSRTVTVELITTLNHSLSSSVSEFVPRNVKIKLHPGEYVKTSYWVKNLSAQKMIVQAIPSVTPGFAAQHIRKTECFCFQHQPLAALEGKEMPLVFTVDPALPKNINTVTLAYTLFDVTQS